MTVRRLSTLTQEYGFTGEGFKPSGSVVIDGDELNDEDLMKQHSDLNFRLTAACLSLCHNSNLVKSDGLWQAIGDPTDSACAVAGWKINGDVKKFSHRHPRQNEFFFDYLKKEIKSIIILLCN